MKLMLRNIGCLLLFAVAWVSCNDDDDVKVGKQIVNPVRVKEIVGHNAHWGDYTLKLAYENDKISTIERFDILDQRLCERVRGYRSFRHRTLALTGTCCHA